MNKISTEIQDSLEEFRNEDDNIRKLLHRKHKQGAAWAINKFRVLKDLCDSETVGLTGVELQSAKKRVDNIIRNRVFNYVENKYVIDENDQVALRSAGAVIPRPTNNQQQRQRQLFRPNPVPMDPVLGSIPFPFSVNYTVNTGTVNTYTGPVKQTNVHHHHSGADQKDIKKIHKNLEDIQEEQTKQGKEIGDLKLSHTDLQTTVHSTLKKKPSRKYSTPPEHLNQI